MLQCQPNQPIGLICHEQRNVQHIIIQFHIIQGEAYTELDLIWEQFLEFLEALAGRVGLGFDLYRENVVFSLNEEIHLIRRIVPAPVPGDHFKLGDQGLKHKVLGQRAFELGEQAIAFAKGRRSQLRQAAEQPHIYQVDLIKIKGLR